MEWHGTHGLLLAISKSPLVANESPHLGDAQNPASVSSVEVLGE